MAGTSSNNNHQNRKKLPLGGAARKAAEAAIQSIGVGYDVADDLRLKHCKTTSSLIAIRDDVVHDILIPGAGISIPNVPKSIKLDKGERIRFRSDVLTFHQMSEQFNQEVALSGKIPLGYFNSAFEYSGCWQQDAAQTKTLAFDGVCLTLYNIAFDKSQLVLRDHVKQAVPSSWDPASLASFIEKFGTHIVVGIKMGGKDMIYAKQQHSSPLLPADVQKNLKEMADKMFIDTPNNNKNNNNESIKHGVSFLDANHSTTYARKEIQDLTFLCKRKGGSNVRTVSHNDWCLTVQSDPDVISMSFIPISSLLSGIHGSGFLTHAINLYLRYKPPIPELHQFLDFQLPRQWAPVFGELALGPQRQQQSGGSLQFSFLGPKLYVNTTLVDVGKRPVTGVRLYLEGRQGNCIGIHLQHLSSMPNTFQLQDEANGKNLIQHADVSKYYEKVKWKSFSHICTAPIESAEDLSIVTGAHFEVGKSGLKKVLFLRLCFSKVSGATVVRAAEWDGSPAMAQKSGLMSSIISTRFTTTGQKPAPLPAEVNINSAIYPGGPPVPAQTRKLLKFVDTTEMTRGPQNSPGYWAVSGAKLMVDKGKISIRVKYSLLAVIAPEDDEVSI